MRGCAHSAARPGAECIGELLPRFSHLSKAFVALIAKADTGDKGVAVLPKILRFYLFSEGPHGARLPCFWSQSLVRSVHLRNPKGTICEVKFCPRGSQNRKKQVKFCEAGGVPTRRPSGTRQKFTPVRRPHAGFTEGRPTPARYFSRNVDEFLEE